MGASRRDFLLVQDVAGSRGLVEVVKRGGEEGKYLFIRA